MHSCKQSDEWIFKTKLSRFIGLELFSKRASISCSTQRMLSVLLTSVRRNRPLQGYSALVYRCYHSGCGETKSWSEIFCHVFLRGYTVSVCSPAGQAGLVCAFAAQICCRTLTH
jgi:hypothetical protein